ncbi:hypothetical protein GWK47_003500 [Chionoecetes opilio]|uniref:Uncharacterized protein n=1 Tax=Chionoecetes opilio TaxID=41210 RepID=A0A8J5D4R0_CHIOP|nr:hypothetical protein GWK47_003500 [Chionoecetes opilio]
MHSINASGRRDVVMVPTVHTYPLPTCCMSHAMEGKPRSVHGRGNKTYPAVSCRWRVLQWLWRNGQGRCRGITWPVTKSRPAGGLPPPCGDGAPARQKDNFAKLSFHDQLRAVARNNSLRFVPVDPLY